MGVARVRLAKDLAVFGGGPSVREKHLPEMRAQSG